MRHDPEPELTSRTDATQQVRLRECSRPQPCLTAGLVASVVLLLAGSAAARDDFVTGSGNLLDLVSPAIAIGVVLLGILVLVGFALATTTFNRRARKAVEEVRRLESLFDVLEEGIVICSGMQVVAANTSLCHLIGVEMEDLHDVLISSFIPDADVIDKLLSDAVVDLETSLRARDGEMIAVEIAARSIPYVGSSRRLLEIRDVRDRQASQRRISFLAHHDPLTTLPNREMMQERLTQTIERASATGQRCALMWIDLDRFKDINDLHGHVAGDSILRIVAEKLRFELPAGTLIARLGGDEFVVLCEDIRDPQEARLIGQQLRRLLNRPIDLGEWSLTVGASIGVAVFPDDASDAEELLRNADLALYHAKAEGRAKCRQFTEALGKERQRRAALSEQLRGAIDHGEIEAYFQPLVRTHDRRVTGFETLARWFHPEFGPIPPPEFVRIAEETGLINSLTNFIIHRAIEAAAHWPGDVRVSVNISPIQINSDLVDKVRDIIKTSGFDPHRLELEVTEDVLIKDFDQTASMFARLRALGMQVAMDDFGSGYTSLGNLRRLNFDRLKIDRIFTADLPNHRRSAAIVRSMFVLARELDLEVTVEGVETMEQFEFLLAEGAAELQGFLFSQPKPLSHFLDIANLKLGPGEPPRVGAEVVDLVGRRSKLAS
jgi:diguanylate cyclase (GGDEF)-like protein/PAS domain S-box-containing protein